MAHLKIEEIPSPIKNKIAQNKIQKKKYIIHDWYVNDLIDKKQKSEGEEYPVPSLLG